LKQRRRCLRSWSMGSPPVKHTQSAGNRLRILLIMLRISAAVISRPSLHAYFVSQKEQRRLQPASRRKIVGSPWRNPSPCREGKISTIFRVGG
jgi:hypothetical protein